MGEEEGKEGKNKGGFLCCCQSCLLCLSPNPQWGTARDGNELRDSLVKKSAKELSQEIKTLCMGRE